MSFVSQSNVRSRKLTKAGLGYTLSIKRKKRDSLIRKIELKMNETESLFSTDEIDAVKRNCDVIYSLMIDFNKVNEEYLILLPSEEEKMECDEVFEKVKNDVSSFQTFAMTWLNGLYSSMNIFEGNRYPTSGDTQRYLVDERLISTAFREESKVLKNRESTRHGSTSIKSHVTSKSVKSGSSLRSRLVHDRSNLTDMKAEDIFSGRRESAGPKSTSFKSHATSKSAKSDSSLKSRLVNERANLAALKAEAIFLRKRESAEEIVLSANRTLERLRIEEKLAKSKAKVVIYEGEDSNEQMQNLEYAPYQEISSVTKCSDWLLQKDIKKASLLSSNKESQNQPVDHNIYPILIGKEMNYEASVENEQLKRDKTVVTDTTSQLLCQLLLQQSAPELEIDTFDGNPLNYQYFIATFEEAVEKKINDQKGRLTRLIKYTTGEAKELIKGCIHENDDYCYNHAKELLKKRYGDPFRVVNAYRKELRDWPQLKYGDAEGFRKFFNFLVKCQSGVKSGRIQTELDSPDTLRLLQSKLPPTLQERWNRKVFITRRKYCREVSLSDFLEFIDDETTLVNDPLFSKEAASELKYRKETPVKIIKTNATAISSSNQQEECEYCKGNHMLKDCQELTKLDVSKRNEFVTEQKLCYGCLKPISKQHAFRSCRNKLPCSLCDKRHPTILHGFSPTTSKIEYHKPSQYPQRVTNTCTTSHEVSCSSIKTMHEIISMSVVPVTLSHPDSKTEIKVYAMLDNCSQGTFVTEHALNLLGIKGEPSQIIVKTLTGQDNEKSQMVEGLTVSDPRERKEIQLPKTYSRRSLPVHRKEIPTPAKIKMWPHLQSISQFCGDEEKLPVALIIGANCPEALEPLELVSSVNNGPYAFRTKLGWNIVGPITATKDRREISCSTIAVSNVYNDNTPPRYVKPITEMEDITIKQLLSHMYMTDFVESRLEQQLVDSSKEQHISQEDFKFLRLMTEEVQLVNGHYQLPLPFKDEIVLPNNKIQAVSRCRWIKMKLERNVKFRNDYIAFMENLFKKEFARKVPQNELIPSNGRVWYLPHHGVYHPKKPDKIRVVFDCSAQYKGGSLNKQLMQGPDLTNKLLGVLIRFRMRPVAFMADIESMFYMVHVPPDQWDYLRFLWWPNGDTKLALEEFQMKVHIFGGVSSPSCSNFALRNTAKDNVKEFGEEVAQILENDFYVDDLLKSVSTVEEAVLLIEQVKSMCAKGGFRLTKFISNERVVIESVPIEDRAKNVKSLDILDPLPIERALGVHWLIDNDQLGFRISLQDKPLTKRGILSTISSIYDPLGLAAPFLLKGKLIMQRLCKDKSSWDSPVSEDIRSEWEKWRENLPELEKIEVPRCIVPKDFGKITSLSLHYFSDASSTGYGIVSYTRAVNVQGMVHCNILIGKSRVAPLKVVTIPRMELAAATVSAKTSQLIRQEIDLHINEEHFWTDSNVVLGYINNEAKRFHIYVANRIQTIHNHSKVHQWNYVPSNLNPADDASKGLDTKQISRTNRWFLGPEFLWKNESEWPKPSQDFEVSPEDREIKRIIKVNAVSCEESLIDVFIKFSRWMKCVRVMAIVLRFISRMKSHWFKTHPSRKMDRKTKHRENMTECIDLSVVELESGKASLIRLLQQQYFASEMKVVKDIHKSYDDHRNKTKSAKNVLKKSSSLYKLNPFLSEDNLLRIGGRLSNMECDYDLKYPIIIPKEHHLTTLIIRWCHEKVAHGGRCSTLNEIRENGYWIINANTAIKRHIHECVDCRALRGKTGIQMMSDLPKDRVNSSPPFTYCGIDFFGPYFIKYSNRKLAKRYGCIFTCMSCRAVHIEVAHSLETDSFIMALRRFIARRGLVRTIRCDNGTNFIGAEREFKREFAKMDKEKVQTFLKENSCQWIDWQKNPPTASHMGGTWERQIKSIKSILQGLLRTHGGSLTEESLHTLLTECECIINSRPLNVETINDPLSVNPLTPMMLLTSKSKVVPPPPGSFDENSLYVRKQWKRIQHITNVFWNRWRKEYLLNLQARQKWNNTERNFQIGDVVLIKEENIERNCWRMGKVNECRYGDDGGCRSCIVATRNASGATNVHRPITKLVLLLENEQ